MTSSILIFRKSSGRLIRFLGFPELLSELDIQVKRRLKEDHPLKAVLQDPQPLIWEKKYLLLRTDDLEQDHCLITVYPLDYYLENIGILRHDLKNHVHTIQGFFSLLGLDRFNFSSCQQDYFHSMGEEIRKFTNFLTELKGFNLLTTNTYPK